MLQEAGLKKINKSFNKQAKHRRLKFSAINALTRKQWPTNTGEEKFIWLRRSSRNSKFHIKARLYKLDCIITTTNNNGKQNSPKSATQAKTKARREKIDFSALCVLSVCIFKFFLYKEQKKGEKKICQHISHSHGFVQKLRHQQVRKEENVLWYLAKKSN